MSLTTLIQAVEEKLTLFQKYFMIFLKITMSPLLVHLRVVKDYQQEFRATSSLIYIFLLVIKTLQN